MLSIPPNQTIQGKRKNVPSFDRIQVPDVIRVSILFSRNPLAQMEEEKREHELKMKKMEAEMEQVFEMKVKEKKQKLRDSELELTRRHEERKKVGVVDGCETRFEWVFNRWTFRFDFSGSGKFDTRIGRPETVFRAGETGMGEFEWHHVGWAEATQFGGE